MPMMATTIINSISVKPFFPNFLRIFRIMKPPFPQIVEQTRNTINLVDFQEKTRKPPFFLFLPGI
jgi:hypothetical protein